jgi:hypothetical protein
MKMSQFGDSGSDLSLQFNSSRAASFFGGRLSNFEPMTEAAICDGMGWDGTVLTDRAGYEKDEAATCIQRICDGFRRAVLRTSYNME